ncbi:hypothetical protein QBC46DRAFT_131377 [Diplogelasinospora grovesii]|uniref:Uncharacterized protein n=1 Tax=Diplogelasinospora grovesii TaxID=303347 RepID=A0AAN6S935_9PEZI|nr:hypothetical protein QBC46DRAFT_131377 [Diplogelasinospora grovesii]
MVFFSFSFWSGVQGIFVSFLLKSFLSLFCLLTAFWMHSIGSMHGTPCSLFFFYTIPYEDQDEDEDEGCLDGKYALCNRVFVYRR